MAIDQKAFLFEETDLVGIGEPKNHLIKWIPKNEIGHQVVLVVGMSGLGKTTLVKQVQRSKVKKHIKVHAWIFVSRSFNIEDFLEDMVE